MEHTELEKNGCFLRNADENLHYYLLPDKSECGGDRTSRHVLDAGYRLAWKRLLTEYHRILKKQSVSEV